MLSNQKVKLGVEKLGAAIEGSSKPTLSEEKKLLMKKNILSQLEMPVADCVSGFAERVGLDAVTRARIKERVFALIEGRIQKRVIMRRIFVFHKKLASAFVLFLMVFGMFFFVSVDTAVVMAETFTTLDSFSGEVFVQRDGEFMETQEGMRIYEKDRVITGNDGLANIVFFDDSISRLAEGTEIVVSKLFRPVQSSVKSYVEISLVDGTVWSRVVNLVEVHSSFVVEAVNMYAATKKAAFNVEIKDEVVEVGVFNSVVDVRTIEEVDTVISGQKAVLGEDEEVGIEEITEGEKEIAWIQGNLDSDQIYLAEVGERLLVAKMESVGLETDENVELGSSVREKALLLLTFDDVKKQKMELDLAEKDFIAAQVKLDEPDLNDEGKEEALEALSVFSEKVEDFYVLVDEVEYADTDYAVGLRVYVEEKVLAQKKSLSLTLPDSPSYAAKEVIEELELLGADETTSVVDLKVEQASTKLSEAEDAVSLGEHELAQEVIEEYKEDMGEVIKMIATIEEEGTVGEDIGVVEKIEEKVVDGLELMGNIEVVSEEEKVELAADLEEAGIDVASEEGILVGNIETEVDELVLEEESDTSMGDYGIKIEGDKPLSPMLSF